MPWQNRARFNARLSTTLRGTTTGGCHGEHCPSPPVGGRPPHDSGGPTRLTVRPLVAPAPAPRADPRGSGFARRLTARRRRFHPWLLRVSARSALARVPLPAGVARNEGSSSMTLDFDFEVLSSLGLTPALASRAVGLAATETDDAQLMRVTEVHRETVDLARRTGRVHRARPLPRLARSLADEGTALAVGDWVLAAVDRPRRALGDAAGAAVVAHRPARRRRAPPSGGQQRRHRRCW